MKDDFSHLDEKDKIKAENDFLKMKLMLERGASFENGDPGTGVLSPKLENLFLKNIIAFEKQFDQQKKIKVFDKIGRPSHFKPAAMISDEKMEEAWTALSNHLLRHWISLEVCSPNISNRELYRFTIEELFAYYIDDVSIPGLMHCFIYDEFHPDPVYDNSRSAVMNCMQQFLNHRRMEWPHSFRRDNLRLNEHYPLDIPELINKVNRFKEAYDELEVKQIEVTGCTVNDKESRVDGKYALQATTGIEIIQLTGNWQVVFELNEELGYWDIIEARVEGIRF